ncbi:MAG: alpha amylase family protein [bacterium]
MKLNKAGFSLIVLLGMLNVCAAQQNEKVAVLWVDPLLNIREIYSRSGIINILTKARESGIGAIALMSKCLTGEVIYESQLAPQLLEWDNYRTPMGFDVVEVFLEEGRKQQLQIYAVFPVFAEGHMLQRQGLVYQERENWQTQVYVVEEGEPAVKPITQWAYGSAAYVNPLLPEVQDYEISLIKEFLEKYSVDGLILDRAQFSGIESDFSDHTKKLFEAALGPKEEIQWWPEDIYQWQLEDGEWAVVPGRYFPEWIEFRAKAMHRFLNRLVADINRIDPTLPVGLYAGAWYPTYYEYGLNWASDTNLIEEDWAKRDYYKTAVAELLNYLIVGCYFPRISIQDSEQAGAEWWMSVEGSSLASMEVVDNVCPVYASVLIGLYKNDSETFKASVQTALSQTNGLYLYDVSTIERYKYWDEIAEILKPASK